MMQHEFEERLGKKVSSDYYEVIETVYSWHPAITDTEGKAQIVALYKLGGIGLMREMMPLAERLQKLASEVAAAKSAMEDAQARAANLRSSYLGLNG